MINSIALSLLLGFELSYYLLIIQTGIVEHYNSDLIALFPMFAGGVIGTVLAGRTWKKYDNPIQKIMIALSLQLLLSFLYPNYNIFTLFLLGLAVGLMAPLGIYLFKHKQLKELLFALAVAYTMGTYSFTSEADSRLYMAVIITSIALLSSIVLREYKIVQNTKKIRHSILSYAPLVLWILLDSNLFETLSRHTGLNIWAHYTTVIIIFHLLGLLAAYFLNLFKSQEHIFISSLFIMSYALSYLEWPFLLAIVYPFTISFYNVVVFRTLSHETSLSKLALIMIFVGWIASGLGLTLALSGILH